MGDKGELNLLIDMIGDDSAGKWFAVVNIFAASRKAGYKWKTTKQLLEKEGVKYEYECTGSAGNAAYLTMEACRKGFRRILAVGGDGTIHDVFNAIMSFVYSSGLDASDFTLGVIPMGSGNDWIKTLGISTKLSSAVSSIAAGRTSRHDIVRLSILDSSKLPEESAISVSYMVNVGGIGIDANVCDIVNHKKKRGEGGKILYIKALIESIRKRRVSPVRVVADGRNIFKGDFLSIAFGVGKYSGGGMRQTPEAVVDDGLVDLTIVPDVPLGRIAAKIFKLFDGTFLTIPELVHTKSKSILVCPESDVCPLIEVDGEIVGKAPLRVDVLSGFFNVIVP